MPTASPPGCWHGAWQETSPERLIDALVGAACAANGGAGLAHDRGHSPRCIRRSSPACSSGAGRRRRADRLRAARHPQPGEIQGQSLLHRCCAGAGAACGAAWTEPGCKLDFPVVRDLHAEGATDYVVMPFRFSPTASGNAMSMTSFAPGGFSTAHLGAVYEVLPVLGRLLEVFAQRRTAGDASRDVSRPAHGRAACSTAW